MLNKLLGKDSKNTSVLKGYRYHIDIVSKERISGWAFKEGEVDHVVKIEVRSNGSVLWSKNADIYREDLAEAGFNDGKCAFRLIPQLSALNSPISTVDIYIDGYCVQQGASCVMTPLDPEAYRTSLDHVSTDAIKGWAFHGEDESHRPQIEIRCGEAVIASGIAHDFRQDLLDANIGDGVYGFTLSPDLALFPNAECECYLTVDGQIANLTPFTLIADQKAIDDAVYKKAFRSEIETFTENAHVAMMDIKRDVIEMNREAGRDDFAVNGQLQTALSNIAELSVRIQVIEQVLVKHFSTK